MSYLGNAGQLLLGTLFSLAMIVLLLRVLLQAAGANFYNPICQLLHKLTQPLIGPLRKVIPPLGRLELVGIVLVWLLALLKVYALQALVGSIPPFAALAVAALADSLSLLLWIWFWALLVGALLSWFPVDHRNPAVPLIYQLGEPLLTPIRKVLPTAGGIDLSAFVAMLAIVLARMLVIAPLTDLAQRLAGGGV